MHKIMMRNVRRPGLAHRKASQHQCLHGTERHWRLLVGRKNEVKQERSYAPGRNTDWSKA